MAQGQNWPSCAKHLCSQNGLQQERETPHEKFLCFQIFWMMKKVENCCVEGIGDYVAHRRDQDFFAHTTLMGIQARRHRPPWSSNKGRKVHRLWVAPASASPCATRTINAQDHPWDTVTTPTPSPRSDPFCLIP
ncbi:hypothetical protein AVEN_61590-1 [Araneus ventricosus]|uniref:Uncharacterized protein n=1 Tax=Araneus ventricosus TaxID=182803 RepID=A0A4Y2NMF4_ARAVE|nr:hypothetical protein AVEN_61590-1 [Araneus ventricosus]